MIVFFKSYVTVAKTTEVKYRDVLCNGSTLPMKNRILCWVKVENDANSDQ